jgi:hypothetical protein
LRWLLILLLEDSLRELVHQCRSSCDGVCHLIQRRFGDLLLSLQWLREGAALAAPLLLIDIYDALELNHQRIMTLTLDCEPYLVRPVPTEDAISGG